MITKQCSKCKEIKPIRDFYKKKGSKLRLHSLCKECQKELMKRYYKNNKEKIKERSMKWYKNNTYKIKKSHLLWVKNNIEKLKKYQKEYRQSNPEKLKEYSRKYYKNNEEKYAKWSRQKRLNIQYCLSKSIQGRIWYSLKGKKNRQHWENIVGFTLQELMAHLEKLFKEGMSFSNYGKWHIDHIYPISSFNFNSYKDKEFLDCWSLNNLQPLWAFENLSKGIRGF